MRSYDVTMWNRPLEAAVRPMPKPAGTELLLRVTAAGVCHSDLHIQEGHYDLGGGARLRMADRGVALPLTMGHEIAGEIVAAGPDAGAVPVGAARLIYPWIGCGACEVCQRGDEHYCLTPRFLGIFRAGGYASHVIVPHPRYCLEMGDLPPHIAAPYACSGLTVYSALRKVDPAILSEEPIVVIGAGGLGLMCLTLLAALGGRGAIIVDIDADKRAAALAAGALQTVDGASPDALREVLASTQHGRGARAVIDFVGAPTTVKLGLDCLTKGGKLVLVGLIGGALTLPLPPIASRAITLQGSYVGSLTELHALLELIRDKHVQPIPTTRRPLDQANAVLDELRAGTIIGRAILTP